jgi:hypothetical protein
MTTHHPSRKQATRQGQLSPPRSARPAPGTGSAPSTTARVVKKVSPPHKGSQQWLRCYGHTLVCVRYREDPYLAMRYTTVELVVDSRRMPLQPHTLVLVSIPADAEATRRHAIELGAKWKRRDKAWLMPLHAAIQLDLTTLVPDSVHRQARPIRR